MYKMFTNKRGIPPGYIRKLWLIMRLTTVILIATFMQVSAAGFAQKITLSKRNAPLEKVIKDLRRLSGFNFIATESVLDRAEPVTIEVKNVEFEMVLDRIFEEQKIDYVIEGRTVTLKRKEKSFLETVIDRFQAIDVRGKVMDSLGNGLPGATVSVKGAKQSTSTNNNGEFYLKNVEEGAVLVVNYLGYVTKEQAIHKDFNYVQLQMSTSKLDEIQVVAYGVTSKRLNTGTVTTVKAEEIERQNINNPLLALQGKVPNLVITPASGVPGANLTLQLRGENSFLGGDHTQRSTPLIVIDGVPFQNNIRMTGGNPQGGDTGNIYGDFSALNYINTKDIESIDVLSDASATSIYGSRGGNGVILITTKKAKAGNTLINANLSRGFSQIPSSGRIDVLGTKEYLTMRKEALANDEMTPQVNTPWEIGYAPDLLLWDQTKEVDWQKELFSGNPSWSTAQLSISGGVPSIQYRIGGTYQNNSSPLPKSVQGSKGSKFEMGTVNFNLTGNSANGKLATSIGGSYSVNRELGTARNFYELAVRLAPNSPEIYKENGELNWELNPNLSNSAATWSNPFAELMNIRETNTETLTSNFSLGYKIIPEITARVTGGYTELNRKNALFTPIAAQDPSIFNRTGTANYNTTRSNTWTIDPQLSFIKKTSIGTLNFLSGISLQGQTTYSEGLELSGYRDDGIIRSMAAAGPNRNVNNSSLDYRYLRFFGRLGYNWENKYLLDLSASRDGSSRFGPGNLYGTYWGIGAGWIFSEETVIKQMFPFLSFGKLRGSYGSNGSDGIGDYNFLELYLTPQYGNRATDTYQGVNMLMGRGVINPNYSWEDIRKAEGGLELAFLNDKVVFSTSYWITRGGNQLASLSLPVITGKDRPLFENQDITLQNSGWDFRVDLTNIANRNFTWKTGANFGFQQNKLLSLPENSGTGQGNLYGYMVRNEDPIGKPISGVKFVYQYRGVDRETGVYLFSDKDGNVNSDKQYFSDAFPYAQRINVIPKSLGISNLFAYKGFSLNLDIQLVKQQAPNFTASGIGGVSPGTFADGKGNQHVSVMNRWTSPNSNTEIQKFTQFYDSPASFANYTLTLSNYGYTDASYVRLRNAFLRYELPKTVSNKMKIQNMAFTISAQNVFTITGFKNGDPETQIGLGNISMPMLQTFTAGVSIQF